MNCTFTVFNAHSIPHDQWITQNRVHAIKEAYSWWQSWSTGPSLIYLSRYADQWRVFVVHFHRALKVGQLCDFREKIRRNVRHKYFHWKGIQRNTITKEKGFIIGPLGNYFDRVNTVTTGHNLEHLTISGRPLVAKWLGCWANAPKVCTTSPGLILLMNLWLVTAPRLGS